MPKDFRRCEADRLTCAGCEHSFGASDDCHKCAIDAQARVAQHRWWKGNPHLVFMGVNVGHALSHSARAYVLGHLRTKKDG